MDRKKEDLEELNKQASLISTTPTIIKATNITTTPTDDDTTSTESSDTFETWTLVNDKEKNKLQDNLKNDNENRVEILKNSDNDKEHHKAEEEEERTIEQEPQLKDSLIDVTNDDFSDGISIISENESVGRISPHPFVTDHLHDLNMKYSLSDHMDDTILNKMREDMENESVPLQMQQPLAAEEDQQLRQRHRSITFTADRDNQALQKASQTLATANELVPLVKRGLQGIFYLSVGLAILGLIGKIVNPTWKPLATIVNSSPSTVELEQKVNDMELQNNLMRAEIDLLNKQVKYLSTLNEPQQQKPTKYKDYKESKTFKAWSGNGDSLKPVDITKQDLKKPYKCPDGSFVEIANMCMEQRRANEPSLVDQFGQVVEDLKEQSEAFKTFEMVAEELQGFQPNPFDMFSEQEDPAAHKKQFIKNKPVYETNKQDPNLNVPHKHNKYNKAEGKYDENYKLNKEFKKSLGKDEYKQSRDFKKYSDPENIGDHSRERNEWKSDKFGNNSRERKSRKDNSKERYTKDFDDSKENSKENQSKERYNKQKRKYNDDSGEWQEKYMKHREQQRKQNEQKYQDNKNWYIKRGDSRENKRSGDKQYR